MSMVRDSSRVVAYYDTASHRVHVYFGDKTQRVMDLSLVRHEQGCLSFLAAGGPGLPIYRLTHQLLPTNVLHNAGRSDTQSRRRQ